MSAFRLSKPSLFNSNSERFVALGIFLTLFLLHVVWNYFNYLKFSEFDDYICDVQVSSHYIKGNRSVLKLKSEDFTFYTNGSKKLRSLQGRTVKVRIFNENVTFLDYLQGFYAPSHLLGLYPQSSAQRDVAKKIEEQHEQKLLASLYKTLLLALPTTQELREILTTFSISHLAALSGFHLGLLAFFLHLLFMYVYKFFQQRYFPWRNRNADIFYLSLAILFIYVAFTDFPPSLLRAYAMMVVGWMIYDRGLELLDFENLVIAVAILFVLKVQLLFSVGLWFSVAGVFYILLFVKTYQNMNKIAFFILLHLWVFITMLPIVHSLFDTFTFLQLLSPLLTMLFIIFYPFELLAHLVGYGGVLDSWLLSLFSFKADVYSIQVPLWFLSLYIVVSLLAVKYRFINLVTLVLALSIFYQIV